MKRKALLKKIQAQANAAGVQWELVREGGLHSIWMCGAQQVSIPRHNDINEITAENIMKDLSDELGDGWWR